MSLFLHRHHNNEIQQQSTINNQQSLIHLYRDAGGDFCSRTGFSHHVLDSLCYLTAAAKNFSSDRSQTARRLYRKFLENTIKDNAYTIYNDDPTEICEASDVALFPHIGDVSSFKDKYNSSFSLNYDSANLEVFTDSIFPAPTFSFPSGQLNSSKVIISSFLLTCNRASIFSAPLVSLNFSICYNLNGSCTSSRPEEEVSLNYQTNIKLRSFPTQ